MWADKRDRTYVDRFLREADRAPDQLALLLDDEEITYGALVDDAVAFARGLIAAGIGHGDQVGLLMPTSRPFAVAWLAAGLAGATVVPINTRFRRRELSYVISKARLRGIVTTDLAEAGLDLIALLGTALPDLHAQTAGDLRLETAPALRFVVAVAEREVPGLTSHTALVAGGESVTGEKLRTQFARTRLQDAAVISFTSGTTSNPKGCVLQHRSLIGMWDAMANRLGVRRGDLCWAPSPMFHAAGYGALGTLAGMGGAVLTQGQFQAARAAELTASRRPRMWYSPFPPVTDAVVDAAHAGGLDLSSVEIEVYASPSPARFDQLSAALPSARVVQPFGQTESTLFVCLGAPDDPHELRRAGCGEVIDGVEMRIADPETGAVVPDCQPGEIQYRGFNALIEYFAEPELTAQTILDGGWVRSGDSGRLNEFGQLQYLGRIKDMLKVGGENVSALEVETHLETHPAVKVAQVVGAPDARLQEVPAAFIELEPGADVDEDTLITYCRGEIARYKIPRYVRFVREWPMSSTKIRKADLRQAIAAELRESRPTPVHAD